MNLEYIYRDLLQKREERLEYYGTIKGTCQEYCPYFEYIERTLRGDVNKYEKDILVKKYYRSSAGRNKAFPEDVRSISVLSSVLDYLLQFCDYSLESYKFLENRTRSIRLDISIQDLECDVTINILEKICRLLILYSYALYDNKEYEDYLNIEQIKKILGTLKDLYSKRGKYNEEFMGYNMIISFDDTTSMNMHNYICSSNMHNYICSSNMHKHLCSSNMHKHLCSSNYNKSMLFNSIKSSYSQNNLYRFFSLVRTTDFLSYCILHTYFDKVRLKGIEIYSKCFIEKIEAPFFMKMLYLTDIELRSLCKKTNIQVHDTQLHDTQVHDTQVHNNTSLIDFKNKDIFINDDILIKSRKRSISTYKLVYLGDIDYHIKRVIMKIWINNLINYNYIKINNKIIKNKVNFNIFTNIKETEKDIFLIILKIYIKIYSSIFVRDIKKKVIIFEKKKRLTKEICLYIFDKYITDKFIKGTNKFIKGTNKFINGTNKLRDTLVVITDDSIFSAIFINNIKKSDLIKYNPIFLQYKDITLTTLLKYKVSVFSLNKKYISDTNSKYHMINKIIDTPQNMSKSIKEIELLVERSKKVIRSKLNILLENKSKIKQISILTYLIHNRRNPDIKEEWIEKINRNERVDNIEVYYEENSSMY